MNHQECIFLSLDAPLIHGSVHNSFLTSELIPKVCELNGLCSPYKLMWLTHKLTVANLTAK